MKAVILMVLLLSSPLLAQVVNPQIQMTGNIGSGGPNFQLINSGTIVIPSDANYTMKYPDMSAHVIKITSAVPLTATRNVINPQTTMGFEFIVENSTLGGQSIIVIGSSGTGVTIPNGQMALVVADGTNYITASSLPTTGNASKVVSSAGLTGPNGTGVCEDGSGNIKDTACQGTYYAPRYCNTFGTLDSSCITNALSAMPTIGGILYLGVGTYNLASTVTISKPVILQGVGDSINCTQTGCATEPPFLPGTLLNWVGAPNSNMLFITPSGTNQAIGGVNLRNISFDTNSITGVTAIDMNCLQESSWVSVSISNASTGMILGCRTGSNTMLNTFIQIEMNLVGTGMIMDGPADGPCNTSCGDAFNNTFTRLHIYYTGTAGIDIKSADNNQFMDLNVYRGSGTGYGIIFEAPTGSGSTARLGGCDEYMYHVQSTTSPVGNEALFNCGGNVIHEWDITNGQGTPHWTQSNGALHNFVTVTNGDVTNFIYDRGLYLIDPDPTDNAAGKGMVVSNGVLTWKSSNHANTMMTLDDFSNLAVNGHVTVGQGMTQSAGFQAEHSATFEGSVTGTAFGNNAVNTFTWPVPFPDNNYTVVCSAYIAQGNPGMGGLTHTPTTITITTVNLNTGGFGSQGAWHCIAVHD